MNKTLKGICVFFSFFIYSYIAVWPLYALHIVDSMSVTLKTIYELDINIIFIGIVMIIYSKDLIAYYKDFKINGFKYIKKGINYWLLGLTAMIIANGLINVINPNKLANNEEAVRKMLDIAPWFIIVSTILFAPIIEEIICRKIIKDIIKSKWTFIITSAIIFGTAHVIFSVSSWIDLLYIIPYGALGFAFAYAFYETNNLLTCMSLHAIHNGILIAIYLFTL